MFKYILRKEQLLYGHNSAASKNVSTSFIECLPHIRTHADRHVSLLQSWSHSQSISSRCQEEKSLPDADNVS